MPVAQMPKEVKVKVQGLHIKSRASQACGILCPWPVPAEPHIAYKQ